MTKNGVGRYNSVHDKLLNGVTYESERIYQAIPMDLSMRKKLAVLWLSFAMLFNFVVVLDVTTDFTLTVGGGSTIYVNTTDTVDYTSIQDAINAASPGDTVFVYSGTYNENVIVNKLINLTGEDRDTTVIDGGGSGDVVYIIASWVNITGFTVTRSGSSSGNAGIKVNNAYGWNVISNNIVHTCYDGITVGSTNETVRGNTVYDYNRYGIWGGWQGVDNSLFEFNTAYNSVPVAEDTRYGIYMYDSNWNIVRNNTAYHNGMGIHLETYASNNTVVGNTVYDNNWYYGINIELFCDNNVVTNNIAHDNIYNIASFRSSYNLIANNTIYNAVQTGLYFEGGDNENNIVRNNLFFSNTDRDIYFWYDAAGTVVTDNYFLDDKSSTNIGNVLLYVADRDFPIVFEKNDVKKYYISQDSAAVIKDSSPLDDWFVFRNRGDLSAKTDVVFSTNRLATFDGTPFTGIDVYPTHSERIFDDSSNRQVEVTLYNAFVIPSSDSVQATVLDFTTSYKRWTMSSVNPSVTVDHRIGDFPPSTEILIKKDGVDWNTYISDSEGYISFVYDEGFTTVTIEAETGMFVPPENCTLLKQGWNLISIPLIQEEQSLSEVLETIDGYYDAVRVYDPSDTTDPWKQFNTDKPFGNDLNEINEAIGVWIHVTRPGDTILLYNGTIPFTSQNIQLHKGWNLVGYPSQTSYNRIDGLNNTEFGTHINKIMWCNTTTKTWHSMEETDYFQKGVGYWFHANEDIVWHVPL